MAADILASSASNTDGSFSPIKQPSPDLPVVTIDELARHDGKQDGGKGDILIALLGTVYDVSAGRTFYGPGGPYAGFAGKDATRGLAAFNLVVRDASSDYSTLCTRHAQGAKRWQKLFNEKYKVVGRLQEFIPWKPPNFKEMTPTNRDSFSSQYSQKTITKPGCASKLCQLL